jgi:hypothetical protein
VYLTREEALVAVLVRVMVWALVVPKEPSNKTTGARVRGPMVTVVCWSRSVCSRMSGVPVDVKAFATFSVTAFAFK